MIFSLNRLSDAFPRRIDIAGLQFRIQACDEAGAKTFRKRAYVSHWYNGHPPPKTRLQIAKGQDYIEYCIHGYMSPMDFHSLRRALHEECWDISFFESEFIYRNVTTRDLDESERPELYRAVVKCWVRVPLSADQLAAVETERLRLLEIKRRQRRAARERAIREQKRYEREQAAHERRMAAWQKARDAETARTEARKKQDAINEAMKVLTNAGYSVTNLR